MTPIRIFALLVILAGVAPPAAAQEAGRLTVTGKGTVEAVPDMATITLGVTHEAETAEAAMARVSRDLAAVLESLQAAGIAERDLQTSGLSLGPVWSDYGSGRQRQITGFSAANTLSVRVRGLATLGETLDRVIAEGANNFRGIRFGLQAPGPVEDAARRAAVADALRKATLYAEAAGVSLGPVLSLSEEQSGGAGPVRLEASASASGDVPLAPGEVSLEARVTMVFALDE